MKAPGVGNRQKRLKRLVGWGKKTSNGRKRTKRTTKKRKKVSRKLRNRRTKRH